LLQEQLEFSILYFAAPGKPARPVGILLLDQTGRLRVQLVDRWDFITEELDREYMQEISKDIAAQADTMGGRELLDYFESTLSNILRISDRGQVETEDPDLALEMLYRQHVHLS
jgi:hypothetical protein